MMTATELKQWIPSGCRLTLDHLLTDDSDLALDTFTKYKNSGSKMGQLKDGRYIVTWDLE